MVGLKGILDSGCILPNDGSFTENYSISKASLGRKLNAISLFDFCSNSLENILQNQLSWLHFFSDKSLLTVSIRIDKSKLDKDKIFTPWNEKHDTLFSYSEDGDYVPMLIPEVEIMYKGSIPVSAFREYILLEEYSNSKPIRINCDHNSLSVIESLVSKIELKNRENLNRLKSKEDLTIVDYFLNPVLYKSLFDEEE